MGVSQTSIGVVTMIGMRTIAILVVDLGDMVVVPLVVLVASTVRSMNAKSVVIYSGISGCRRGRRHINVFLKSMKIPSRVKHMQNKTNKLIKDTKILESAS